jgi:hypothetical protein
MNRIFISVPSYDHRPYWYTNISIQSAFAGTSNVPYSVTVRGKSCSLLPHGFNQLWVEAINEGFDYFVMLHADVHPDPGWLNFLTNTMHKTGADVISSVIAIKDEKGNSSTAIGKQRDDNFAPAEMTRFIKIDELPRNFTFAFSDLPPEIRSEGEFLMINTGCFLANITRPWARKTYFEIYSWIREMPEGKLGCGVLSEDWSWSWQLHKLGCKVLATNAFNIKHYGPMFWENQPRDSRPER